jgi:DNA-binding LytR/AlgR family response regulator
MILRTVIVEDEPLAIERLRSCLAYAEKVEVIGHAEDGLRAVELIDSVAPDLVFLDVRLPGCSGFEVLRRLQHKPAVIFTTAYEEYAVPAFEWGAFDYLLKPFSQDRVRIALLRIEDRLRPLSTDDAIEDRLRSTEEAATLSRFFVRYQNTVIPIDTKEIITIRAEDDYSAVHVGGRVHLVHLPLREFVRRLDPARFARIHRSTIVNLEKIARIEVMERRMAVASRVGAQALRSRQI